MGRRLLNKVTFPHGLGGYLSHRACSLCAFQQIEGNQQDVALSFPISRRPHGPSHEMGRNYQSRQVHAVQPIAECGGGNDHAGNARFLQQARNVSHGHVTDRSDRHQHDGVNSLRLQQLYPLRPRTF